MVAARIGESNCEVSHFALLNRRLCESMHFRDNLIMHLCNLMSESILSATEMNERSSRSHTILSVYLSMAGSDTNDMFISDSNSVGVGAGILSQLNLVDLAGSGAY